ncbi:MAG: type IV toxin-antitoxin system AbiEi family antitoxin domain-containing protein [Candidatus Binatia bacterium]
MRQAGDVISIDDAVRAFGVSRAVAAKLMSRWTSQRWLRRVGSGVYVSAELQSLGSDQVLDDPWVLVPTLFAPGYVGGRSAAEHWDLTEQIFRDIVVVTSRPVRRKSVFRHGAQFTLKHIDEDRQFGTKVVWRHNTKVSVSDVPRTIADIFDDPAMGGGVEHVSDCFSRYLRHPNRDDAKLMTYAMRLNSGALFKRLGFLAERSVEARDLAAQCRLYLTKGTAKLDPALTCDRLITRWRLWVPNSWVPVKRT